MAKKPSTRKPKAPREIELKPVAKPLIAAPRAVQFSDVVGQDRAIGQLRAAMRSERLHHAWIFHGPPGIGKFTAALAFAGTILDPTSQPDLGGEIAPDPDSPTQRLLRAGSHPDLHIVTKELASVSREASVRDSKQRNIAIDVVREFLIEPAERSGTGAGGGGGSLASRVFIIDEAELLAHGTNAAQNAILKTLEEPPPGCVIILVTSQEERLLPTIRSRSQRVAFAPLSEADMNAWFKASSLDLSGLDEPSRQWLLAFSAGSPGTAKLALETGLIEWHKTVGPMLADLDRAKFPIDFGTVASKLTDEWAEAWVERHKASNPSKEAANQAASRQMMRLISEHYRQQMRGRAGPDGPERASRAIDLIRDAERHASCNVSLLFVLDNLAAQLCSR